MTEQAAVALCSLASIVISIAICAKAYRDSNVELAKELAKLKAEEVVAKMKQEEEKNKNNQNG